MPQATGWVFVDVGDPALAALLLDVFREATLQAVSVETARLPPPSLVVTTLADRTEGLFPGVSEIILIPIEDEPTLQQVARRHAIPFVLGRPFAELALKVRRLIDGEERAP